MGWKGTLRSVRAADRRYQRDTDRHNKQVDRSLSKIHRDADAIRRKAVSLQNRASKDIIKALGLAYGESTKLQSEPIVFSNDSFDLSLSLISTSNTKDDSDESHFEPDTYAVDEASVSPLAVILSSRATLVAFRVEAHAQGVAMKCNWIRKNDPRASKVFLLDAEHSRYYYPTASDLGGDVLSGHPRTGLVAFEPLQQATSELEIHFTDVKLSSKRGELERFQFAYTSATLADQTSDSKDAPTITETVDEYLDAELDRYAEQANKAKSGSTSLITWAVLIIVILVVIGAMSG